VLGFVMLSGKSSAHAADPRLSATYLGAEIDGKAL
jgi:hypothetical protein